MGKTKKFYYIIPCLLLLLLSGCNDESKMEVAISQNSYLNSEGDILSFLVGLRIKGQDRPASLETRPFLLKVNEKMMLKSVRQISNDWVFRDMGWRPATGNLFYYMTFERVYGSGPFYEPSSNRFFKRGDGKLMMLDADSDYDAPTEISQGGFPNVTLFHWSPDGSILAGLSTKPDSEQVNSGELAISYDGGKTFALTGINMHGGPLWLNSNELYLMPDHGHTIIKVFCDGSNVRITETFSREDCQIIFNGLLDEKIVYTAYPRKDDESKPLDKSRRLFVGNELVHETNDTFFRVFTFPYNIVIESDNRILIYDENLSVCHERRLGRNTHLLNFQPDTKTVFLVRDWKTILCYNYTKKASPHILFSVDMLDDLQ